MKTNRKSQIANRKSTDGALAGVIAFCLENKLVVILITIAVAWFGFSHAPFDWDVGGLPRDPIPVDAIPDIGENQQIVFTEWMGRSPQDVEDQITYPMTVSLLGMPGVKTVRSFSMFGLSSVYVIFEEDVEFYWSRSRILEKLNSLPAGTLPEGVKPALGPDATALGQVFWYTLEGLDAEGNPTGGWGLDELRSIQDWYVRYGLLSAKGISEVASVGGFVREYQVDVDPDAMRAHGVKLDEVFRAVKMANIDVGAKSIEVNKVEYFIRGVGFIKSVEDVELSVVKVSDNVPIYVKDVANVSLGPALRRGALDKGGVEAVGGVAVVRYGGNPLDAIKSLKKKINAISPGLPRKTLADGTVSQVAIVPFYDRTGLIYETLGTLNTAIYQEILVTIIIVLIMVRHLASSVLISGLLPMAVLMTFIGMRYFGVDANIVALSGIAIAIGTMVDMGIVICENILRKLQKASGDGSVILDPRSSMSIIYDATTEVGSAVLTAVATTIVGFLPVFAMIGPEGKLFKPLAYTKTFALMASVIVALTLIPPFAHLLFSGRLRSMSLRRVVYGLMTVAGIVIGVMTSWWAGAILFFLGLYKVMEEKLPERMVDALHRISTWLLVALVAMLLTHDWLPLGPEKGLVINFLFIALLVGGLLFLLSLFQRSYSNLLRWALDHKAAFLSIPGVIVVLGLASYSGLGKEFMPPLDEGSYLFMPTTMPHASIGEALDVLQKQDLAIEGVPEVESVVGKLGRAESSLDPAPISMFETVINYKPEYLVDRNGKRMRFKYDSGETDLFRTEDGAPAFATDGQPYTVKGRFVRDDRGKLIPDNRGAPFRLWRLPLDPDLNDDREAWEGINSPDDIWDRVSAVTSIPGTTPAPKLQPIAARIVMLQSGMRAPMGVKVYGPDLETIEKVGVQIERFLKEVPSVRPATVVADRIIGKPYLEIEIDREAIGRYGVTVSAVQDVIEVAIGGKPLTMTVEGRERYPVRVRYLRELRDQIETLGSILVPTMEGAQIPLTQLSEIRYVRGPQMIKSEDTFLVGYVVFDMKSGNAEVDVVEACQRYLDARIESGEFVIPKGVNYKFAGSYENQIRATKKLVVVIPLALFIIFIILYLQFKSTATSLFVFSGILVAWAGGFIMVWMYGQSWFLDFSIFGTEMRELFQIHTVNLSVAVWVGFLALFGIASDNGVIVATILDQLFGEREVKNVEEVRSLVIEGAQRRIRPALMTSATTILALIPVLTSAGRGSEIMIPMAIPSFGGMAVALITVFVVPVLYCAQKERAIGRG